MCTTVGFSHKEGFVFGRTLEVGVTLDNEVAYIPSDVDGYIKAIGTTFSSKYATIGSAFSKIELLGDGINEMGLMGSNNLLPHYATFSPEAVDGKINLTTSYAFNYLLTRCSNVAEVREEASKMNITAYGETKEDASTTMHFFFMDATGEKVVLEPINGMLVAYDNPYGVLTNAPEFDWHETNLKNYLHLQPENIEKATFNETTVSKLGEGTGMLGVPGDFTPPSRFVRAAYFVANTPKQLNRHDAILQNFRILSQFDIPTGAVIETEKKLKDETLYTSVMDTKENAYFIKCHDHINIQPFYLKDYMDKTEITFLTLKKEMSI
ncbi:linear amide C-N hydrolase [Paraliobacillus salinarum]|uniref:linear amide C-N hydrolase n=1 Tax=Paraliobacillus salinarum TaxID=1158996 RepID=UPI0015F47723|nr:linear amide C-N hydrolase [Paraliobacillus salinarum]